MSHQQTRTKCIAAPLPFLFNGFNQLVVYDLEKVCFRLRKEMSDIVCQSFVIQQVSGQLLGGMVPAQVCKLCIGKWQAEN